MNIMNRKYYIFIAIAVYLTAASPCAALDSIKTKSGGTLGKIVGASPLMIEVEQGASGQRKEIPVNQIDVVFYNDEPTLLKNAKNSALAQRYEEALTSLGRFKIEDVSRKELREEVEFYTALCTARSALGGSGKIADAGRLMIAFIKNYPESYHYFQACETVGDLLVAHRSYLQAEEYYAKLSKAPWPDYQMKAGVAAGRVLLAQGKNSDALSAFKSVLSKNVPDELSKSQYQAAEIGKAAALVALKKYDDAMVLIDSIIGKADPDDADTMACAYNLLGNVLRQQGKKKEALMAFLHVDLLYSSAADAHAEALYNLTQLWDELNKADRSLRARQTLEQQYKNSPWAQKGG
jgi:tetratricopeptide (TPR) repeat protein